MQETDWHWIVTTLLASSVPIVLAGGLYYRFKKDLGIGWQFIRYSVLTISIPIIGLLALNEVLSPEAATLIGTAIGFAFGKDRAPSRAKKIDRQDKMISNKTDE